MQRTRSTTASSVARIGPVSSAGPARAARRWPRRSQSSRCSARMTAVGPASAGIVDSLARPRSCDAARTRFEAVESGERLMSLRLGSWHWGGMRAIYAGPVRALATMEQRRHP